MDKSHKWTCVIEGRRWKTSENMKGRRVCKEIRTRTDRLMGREKGREKTAVREGKGGEKEREREICIGGRKMVIIVNERRGGKRRENMRR